jgi:transposase
MPKYKSYNYHQTTLVSVDLEKQFPTGSLEFAIHYLVDNEIDLIGLDSRYKNDDEGRPAYDPRILLKVVLLAYARGLLGSRQIERACRENITFMALSCGQCPDHSTIATFITSMQVEIVRIFRNILLICEKEGLLGSTSFSLDGLKLPANASKDISGTFAELTHKKKKIEEKVRKLIKRHKRTDDKDNKGDDKYNRNQEQQIDRLKRWAGKIDKFLKENEPKINHRGQEIKSNITDNDSEKMVTSHGTIQGYNGQALVDDKFQIIVHAEAMGKGQDREHVLPMIDGAKENIKAIGLAEDYFKGKEFTADSNYHSTVNLKKCNDEELDAYIPDVNFRKRDPRFKDQNRYKPVKKKRKHFKLEDFTYNQATDSYTCPNGEKLTLRARHAKIKTKVYRRYGVAEGACDACRYRKRCLKTPTARRKYLEIDLGRPPEDLVGKMIAKIDTQKGKERYERRLAIVEPVFANIRTQKRLDRFTLRGKLKVNVQWKLYCIIHNIEKIVNYGVSFA